MFCCVERLAHEDAVCSDADPGEKPDSKKMQVEPCSRDAEPQSCRISQYPEHEAED